MTKKQFLRFAGFAVLVGCLVVSLCVLFEYENSNMLKRFKTLNSQQKNTIDAVYAGSSAVDRYWIAGKAFDDYGMTVYPVSTDAQASWVSKPAIEEAMKKQDIKLIILDIRSFAVDPFTNRLTVSEARSRRVIDSLPFFSLARLKAIKRTQNVMHYISVNNDTEDDEISRYDISYFFTLIRYHSKWKEDNFNYGLKTSESKYLGFYTKKSKTIRKQKIALPEFTDKVTPIDTLNLSLIDEMIDFANEKGAHLLFVDSPRYIEEENYEKVNYIQQYLEEKGCDYFFTNSEEMWANTDLDIENDFYNEGHVNYWGAVKYTDMLSKFIDEKYDLPDRRDDPKAKSWHGRYEALQEMIDKWTTSAE